MILSEYLQSLGYAPVQPAHYARVAEWRAWYQGKVEAFHNYVIHNKGKPIRRVRAGLNMAKQGAEYWANLLWNEDCHVNLEDPALDALVNRALRDNDFWRQTNQLTERAWAMGTGAYVAYPAEGRTRIDYIGADMIFPLACRNGEAESCAFAATMDEGGKRRLYLMIHEKQGGGSYRVSNRFFVCDPGNGQLTEEEHPKDVLLEYIARTKRFALVKPNIVNNLGTAPMGISVYANCIDTLKSIDMAYDGIQTAMEVGRPRMGVTSNMLRVDVKDGEIYEVFDAGDIAVYDMGGGGTADRVEVRDLTPPYRAENFERSLQAQLQIYSQCIGLGEKAFRWEGGTAPRTATEVVSQNSGMLRAMQKHQEGLRSAIATLGRAILDIEGVETGKLDAKVTVVFDDSVTRDRGAEAEVAWRWVESGRFPFWEYLVRYQGFDETEAKRVDAGWRQGNGE